MRRSRWVGPGRLALTAVAAGSLVTLAVVTPPTRAVPSADRQDTASTLEPVASAALSCPGPELSGVSGVEDIEVPARVAAGTAPDSVLAPLKVSGEGTLTFRTGQDVSAPITERGVTSSRESRKAAPSDVLATGAMAPGLAATQEWVVGRDEINGLATVPCAGPGSDLWLVAGGGAAGRQERLILSNPGANEVTVDLQVLGRKGLVPSPTGTTVVPARGRVALLVDAISGAEESPALRVRANGGTVRAVMSDIWLDGSVPVGAETTVPTAAPSRRQVIPAAIMRSGGSIRIAVPDRQQAVVSARVIGEDGPVPVPGGGVIRVPGQSTGELALTGLAQGTYTVEVTADVPIVASLFASWRVGTSTGDFIWAPSTTAASGLLGAVYPQGPERPTRIVNIAASGGPAAVSVTSRVGGAWSTTTHDLAQDTSKLVILRDPEAIWVRRVSGAGEVRAGVGSLTGTNAARQVSVAPLVESPVTSTVGRAHPVS